MVSTDNNGFLTRNATYSKAKSLADRGHDVFLLIPSDNEEESRFDGHVHLVVLGTQTSNEPGGEDMVSIEDYASSLSEAIEDLHREVRLDVVEFPDMGTEGYAYLSDRDPKDRFPIVVQNRGSLPAFASSIGKSDIVFQPNLPIDQDMAEASSSRLAILKAETYYHFAVNRSLSKVYGAYRSVLS